MPNGFKFFFAAISSLITRQAEAPSAKLVVTLDEAISRALTAGPGQYDLFVAWADASTTKGTAATHVARRRLPLPVAPSGLHLGSIVLAQSLTQRDVPYSPAEQAAHPYSIGAMEITPRNSADFTRDHTLTAVFQIMNAQARADAFKPLAVK